MMGLAPLYPPPPPPLCDLPILYQCIAPSCICRAPGPVSAHQSQSHLGCRRAGSRPRLPSSCSRTCCSQSSPPSRRTGSGAQTRCTRSNTSAWHRVAYVQQGALRHSAHATRASRLWRAERAGQTRGEAKWRPSAVSKL